LHNVNYNANICILFTNHSHCFFSIGLGACYAISMANLRHLFTRINQESRCCCIRMPPPALAMKSSPQFDSNMHSEALAMNASHVFDEMPHSSFRAQVVGRARGSGLCTTALESDQELGGPDPSPAWPCRTPLRGCTAPYAPSR
jgi:hypothetical protein